MRVRRPAVAGAFGVSVLGAVLLGTELPRPSLMTTSHAIATSAEQSLINDPRLSVLLSESAQEALAPLKTSTNNVNPSPLFRPAHPGALGAGPASWTTPQPPLAFNNDQSGYPQNEESVSTCSGGHDVVGAWNDYRGLATNGDFTGWGISTNSGTSLRNSGLLPGVMVSGGTSSGPGSGGTASGNGKEYLPTQGDPVIRASGECSVYASSLAFPTNFGESPASAVVVDLSTASTLATCTTQDSCWYERRAAVASTDPSVFFDKDWMALEQFGGFVQRVWVGFTKYQYGFYGETTSAQVVACAPDLRSCSAPITLESDGTSPYGPSSVPTFVNIAVGSDGRTYVSWATITQSFTSAQSTVQVNVTSAAPGTKSFGAPVAVTSISSPVLNPFDAESFRINAFPSLAVSTDAGVDRVNVAYGQCRATSQGICEHSEVMLATSKTGAFGSWSYHAVDASTGSDFFPVATADTVTGGLVVGYWTTRFDPQLHRYDAVAVPVNAATGVAAAPVRITTTSIEPDSDPLLGPSFIGDYWDIAVVNGTGWAHYTSTQRLQRLAGQGVPVPQQDNVLSVIHL